jgi:hypothetical protein
MEDMSNKSLVLLLLAAIVISLGGTFISLNKLNQEGPTGLAAGQVNLTMSPSASCRIDSNVTFGSGTQPVSMIFIGTNNTNTGTGFNDCTTNPLCYGMMVNNTGNVNVNVTFYSNINGTTLLGGPGAGNDDFNYSVMSGTNAMPAIEPGCQLGLKSAWTYVNETVTLICSNLTYVDTNDMLNIEYNISIDSQTPANAKTALITITCSQV